MSWKFDKIIAESYLDHVRSHIPDFDIVIDKTVECCVNNCNINDQILDFGCATGYTLQKLYESGFRNLYGVDNSQDMLNRCNTSATYFCADDIPKIKFNAIIANWVLHFNLNKTQLIKNMYNQLDDNGLVLISDKLSQTKLIQERYYSWKQSKGVSVEEITRKEKSLVGVMNLHALDYYYNTLIQSGFKSVEVIHGGWGFISLIAKK